MKGFYPQPLTAETVASAAHIHSLVFPAQDAWSTAEFADLLALPGVHGWLLADRAAVLLGRRVLNEAELLTLAVLPACRRQGLARHLMQVWITEMTRASAEQLFLEVSALNAGAQALYAKLGFTGVGERRGYYSDGSSARLMVLHIGNTIVSSAHDSGGRYR